MLDYPSQLQLVLSCSSELFFGVQLRHVNVAIAAILQKAGHLNHLKPTHPISYKLPPEKWMMCFSVFVCSAFFYGLSFPQAVSSLGNRSKLTVQQVMKHLIMAVQK